MQASDIVSYARILLSTPGGTAVRWPDAYLITLADRAVKAVVATTYFPESRLTGPTILNQQEYQIPQTHVIYRVYVNGQPYARIPGGIDTLEGNQIQMYDSTAQGVQTPGSGAATNSGGSMQPQWAVATPVTAPFINSWGSPAPAAQPYFPGQSPRYYERSGFLGLVPAPGQAGAQITVDCVQVPATLTTLSSPVVVPDNFMEAIVSFILWRAGTSDDSDRAMQKRQIAYAEYDREIRKLRTWKRQYQSNDDQMLPQTYRGSYRVGGNRAGDGNDFC